MSRRPNVNGGGYVKPRKDKNPSVASTGCDACTDRTPRSEDLSPSACIDQTQQRLAILRSLSLGGGRRCVTSPDRLVQTRDSDQNDFARAPNVSFPKLPRRIEAWLRKT